LQAGARFLATLAPGPVPNARPRRPRRAGTLEHAAAFAAARALVARLRASSAAYLLASERAASGAVRFLFDACAAERRALAAELAQALGDTAGEDGGAAPSEGGEGDVMAALMRGELELDLAYGRALSLPSPAAFADLLVRQQARLSSARARLAPFGAGARAARAD
jgi:hypothetical protein